MNDVLELKGSFKHAKAKRPGPVCLPANATVTSEHIDYLINNLYKRYEYWLNKKESSPIQPLISIHYNGVVAKSNRVRYILGGREHNADNAIRGAKFDGSNDKLHHVITYSVSYKTIEDTLDIMKQCNNVIQNYFDGYIDNDILNRITTESLLSINCTFSKSYFAQIIRDIYYIDHFSVEYTNDNYNDDVIVSLYDTAGKNLIDFMQDIGFDLNPDNILNNAMRLTPDEYSRLIAIYPYLVSMSTADIAQNPELEDIVVNYSIASISDPNGEPIIGVIDTPFDDRVYFSKWVDYHNDPLDNTDYEQIDCNHGTAISSIIVDGPSLNPELDDECGHFRVRHFGIAKNRSNSFNIIRRINQIVRQNRDIKVWNLSLGSKLPIPEYFISPEAEILDELQAEFKDIVFVVAGTNKDMNDNTTDIIGAPADSINSIVVNATDFDGATASYSRHGPVLKFYKKPDVCAVGGDNNKYMHLCVSTGETWLSGTSFAAPWIARKMAYLMQVMGFTREVAKALLIDTAAGWDFVDDAERGYGFVPIKISDILKTPNDEIRFILSGSANEYETYNYDIPIPVTKETHPYIARATMCYFPNCDRKQGVDYASTEMDLHFGRIKDNGSIASINNNCQGDPSAFTYEKQARDLYRKWDNVKHIGEELKPGLRARKAYSTGMWGLNIRLVERNNQDKHPGHGMPFGIVITLKDIENSNRIDEFIQRCSLRGWIVNRIDIENRIDIYNAAQVEIDFED